MFGDTTTGKAVQFVVMDDKLFFRAPFMIENIQMNSGDVTQLPPGEFHPAELMKLYRVNKLNFVVRQNK